MNEIKNREFGKIEKIGEIEVLKAKIRVTVKEGSFLHIGNGLESWQKMNITNKRE